MVRAGAGGPFVRVQELDLGLGEDGCFPPDRVADDARDLMALLSAPGFLAGVAGHAAYGNLHFVLTAKLSDQADRDRYAAFMSDLVDLVVGEYDGSLKAEHGTGLNMAPFVTREKKHLDAERQARMERIEVLDAIAWCHRLLPALTITGRLDHVAVHPTCAATHLGLTGQLERIAGSLARQVTIPVSATCCGTAGDRGLLHPELVVGATRDEAAQLAREPAQAYLSANRTCEMGLRHGTGLPFESFVFLLEQLSRPAAAPREPLPEPG